ncbi:MAG TPA: hypothetical protein VII06_36930 [Chloroflexota bacterium]|jgi:hypothetical protein
MLIDDEIWPPTKELVELHFENAEDFEKCWWLIAEQWGAYRCIHWDDLVMEVRKSHKYLVEQAGVPFREFEIADWSDLPTDERLRLERESARAAMKIWLERLRRENGESG